MTDDPRPTAPEPTPGRRDGAGDEPSGDEASGVEMVGRTITDRYRILELVARGGMGAVYRARDVRLERDVALKILSSPYTDDPGYVDRFLSEARTAASISHTNLVHVYDSGSDGSLHYMAMELLEGYRPLRDVIRSDGPAPVGRAAAIATEILSGLRAVHARGLVHCDVKSANVMVRGESVKLIDFGIARSRADEWPEGHSIGSLHYMAPEQRLGQPLTPATDIYSVGVVLYESLTGALPYGGSPDEVAEAQRAGRLQPPSRIKPSIPERLERAVMRALDRDPSRRFQTADDMAAALEGLAAAGGDRDDRTRPQAPPGYRYMPPVAPTPAPRAPAPAAQPIRHQAAARPAPRPAPPPPRRQRGSPPWGAIAIGVTLIALAGLVWVGLDGAGLIGSDPSATPGTSGNAAATGTPPPAGQVEIPNVIGMTEDQAIAAANDAGLNWTLNYRTRPELTPGVYAQEPDAGTLVNEGAPFTFWSNRP